MRKEGDCDGDAGGDGDGESSVSEISGEGFRGFLLCLKYEEDLSVEDPGWLGGTLDSTIC